MKHKLIGKWHVAAFFVFFCVRTDSQRCFYNQRGPGEFGNMVAANLTSYTQAKSVT